MKSLKDFIKESRKVDEAKVEVIAREILKKDKKLLKGLQDESAKCLDDDWQEWEEHVIDNIEDYPARWTFIQAIAKELKMDPKELIDEVDWHTTFFMA